MSEHITRTALCDDNLHLLNGLPPLHTQIRAACAQHPDIARMGAITRSADRWTPHLFRAGQSTEQDPRLLERLAFGIGALTHRSADRHMKPIIRCWEGDHRHDTIEPDAPFIDPWLDAFFDGLQEFKISLWLYAKFWSD
jgi:hypothetical protein